MAWISLVEIDPGNEQPVDLEDWSAHKGIAQKSRPEILSKENLKVEG